MPKEAQKMKTCFVIAPIGEEASETRRRSDQVLTHIVKPAAKECGYEAVRADEISEPGIITSQVIQHVIDDDLVIADLTDRNPNVFYELAVRHTVKKPVVQIIQADETIPFDIAPTRTIHFDYRDLDSVANCKDELVKQIHSVEKDPEKVDSPISVAIDLKSLRQSENPLEKSNAEIISMLQDLPSRIGSRLLEEVGPIRRRRLRHFHPRMLEELAHMVSEDPSDPIGLVVIAGLVRDDLPWLYEVIMEVYREVKGGTINAQKARHRLRGASEVLMGGPWMEELGIYSKEMDMLVMELPMILDHYLSKLEARTKRSVRGKTSKTDVAKE